MFKSLTGFISGLIITIGLFTNNSAQARPTLKDYGTLPEIQHIAISPSGDLVAFRKVTNAFDRVIVTSLSAHKQIANIDVKEIQPYDLYFLNEDQLVLLASEYKKMERVSVNFDVSTAFMYNLNDKSIRQLLIPGEEPVVKEQAGLGHLIGLSPDGKYAYMPAYSFVKELGPDVSVNFGNSEFSLLKVNLKEKKPPVIFSKGTKSTYNFFVDDKDNVLAQISYDQKSNIHRVRARQNNEWVEIFKENVEVLEKSFVGVTPDFKSLVVLDTNKKTGRIAYYTMSLANGSLSEPIFGRDDADIEQPLRSFQRVVYGVRYSGFTPSYQFFDPKLNQRMKDILAKFPEQSVYLSNFSEDWKNLVVNVEGSNSPSEYFLFSDGKEPQFLTSSYPNIKAEDLHPTGKVTFSARDGLKIPTLLTIPKDKVNAMKNLPTIIMPHGGPESHDTIGFDWMAQAFADNGYLVIQPQFRGSDGFGLKHFQAGLGEWGKKMQDDISDAVNFAVKKGITDPSRVCIVGASYGGYAALAGGAFSPELYKCIVAIAGVGNLKSMLNWEKMERGSESSAVSYWKRQFANGEINNEALESVSPEKFAENFKAPVLLIHGSRDKTVPIEQSEDMNSALKSAKKPVKFIKLEKENHYLLESETKLKTLEESLKFVNSHIGQI
ncbi:MAG: S9 family peptidase [Gammaproteobacteria bacterium]|nr:MAG: S9 family peptidase [Gammaproteobacteria bacterium]